MRLGNNSDARRRRVLLLSKRLDEFAAARRELLRQLVDLDAQASAAQLEHDHLHNLDAPISHVPDEVLAMIFEEGMHPQDRYADHFGVVVSHVTQRWRNVSLETPKLWNSGEPPLSSPFLSRARSLPLNIHIESFRKVDLSSNFLQLISDHMEHCRQLRIVNVDQYSLMKLLEVISPRPMPLLAWIDLGCSGKDVEFEQRLFPSGVPRLTTATINQPNILGIHLGLPAFQCLTSLKFTVLNITTESSGQGYRLFRNALMVLPALRHLDLSIGRFLVLSFRVPILLPNIQHLHVESYLIAFANRYHDNLLRCIQAPSLVALSLSKWNAKDPFQLLAHQYERHFPSLQHLVLTGMPNDAPHIMMFARVFPCIERLTFQPSYPITLLPNINDILSIILCDDGDRAENSAYSGPMWLHSFAMLASRESLDARRLKSTILKLQAAGHPIRKLMLPREVHPAIVEVGETMELEDFYVDWPTPFDWCH